MYKITTEEFIYRARKVHGDKYDYSKVNYLGSKKKVTIICPIHGEFEQLPFKHLQGNGCSKCSNKLQDTETFIEKARKIHGDKYDYSKVEYVNNHTKVCLICPEHGEFWQTPMLHLLGHGCKHCHKRSKTKKLNNNKYDIRYTTSTWIKAAKNIWGDRYDYSKVKYVNCDTKVIVTCPKHGDFKIKPSDHLRGNGCKMCAIDRTKLSREEFIQKAIEVHGNKYDYSKVDYVNNYTDVCIICQKHGEFWQKPSDHLQGNGCKKCHQSHLERIIKKILKEKKIKYKSQYAFDWLKYIKGQYLDIYLPDYNIAIECQGLQHFKPINYFGGEKQFKKTCELDINKFELCKKHNIKVIYIINDEKDYIESEFYKNKEIFNLKNIEKLWQKLL